MYQKQTGSIIKHLDFLLLDLIVMEVSFILAYMLRHGPENPFANSQYRILGVVLFLVQFLVVVFRECYRNILRRGYLQELKSVVQQNVIVMLLTIAFVFVTRAFGAYSRQVILVMWVLVTVLMYGERLTWKNVLRKRLRTGEDQQHMLVIGEEEGLEEIIQSLRMEKYWPFRITGAVVYKRARRGDTIGDVPVVADWDEIFDYARKEVVDEVLLNLPNEDEDRKALTRNLLDMGIAVHVNLDWSQTDLPNRVVENIGNCTVLTTSIKTATTYQIFMKRVMDIAGSLVGLLFTGILFVIIGPLIYIQSPGPILFSQIRVGRGGRKFRIYKFRSMYTDAEERKKELMAQNKMNGLMFKMDNDPRIFPVGRIIRKLSIDEFPQFWNILKGDMSLVGTRPPTVDEFEQYEARHKVRLSIKPGLTGMWQVSGRSDITDFEEVVALDDKYIAEWNLRLDIKILWKTVLVVLGNKGAV
ncbi:MAG: sugar transferase [Clostridiales bacterium]|nr:sugar transferase [Clostridiales bacterium]